MRVVGPNCLGVMVPSRGLNATFAGMMAQPGNIAFISQSGALAAAILDWSLSEQLGFSAFVSIGAMIDVDWGDLISYFGRDRRTQSIIIYMESLGAAKSFLAAAREVAINKPIIVLKGGQSEAAAQAISSHTGALTGSNDVLDAAFRRAGVIQVKEIADMFRVADALTKQPAPRGPQLTILTNAGGPGVLATDALVQKGGRLAALDRATSEALNELLPLHWSRNNPIDILDDAGPERYQRVLEIISKDPNTDGLLVILAPQEMTNPTQIAEQLKPYASVEGKPILASWLGGAQVQAGIQILRGARIPTYSNPATAGELFGYMWNYGEALHYLKETPSLAEIDAEQGEPNRAQARDIIRKAGDSGHLILSEAESKKLLEAYGIPAVDTRWAATGEEAAAIAEQIGYPVALKLHSRTITHKTDVGGVFLNLPDRSSVIRCFTLIQKGLAEKAGEENFEGVTIQPMFKPEHGCELIIGSSIDPQVGPVMLFGLGGQLVEVIRDRALELPPLNRGLARRLIERTKAFTVLKGIRGKEPAALGKLEDVLMRFGQLIVEQKRIMQSDINPLIAHPGGVLALDARFILHPAAQLEKELPSAAIPPYPDQYACTRKLADGTRIMVRPVRPQDEEQMLRFFETLPEADQFLHHQDRLHPGKKAVERRLTHLCLIDYDQRIVFVAELHDYQSDTSQIIGVAGLLKARGSTEAQFSLLLGPKKEQKEAGVQMLAHVLEVARREGLETLTAYFRSESKELLDIIDRAGFHIEFSADNKYAKTTTSVNKP